MTTHESRESLFASGQVGDYIAIALVESLDDATLETILGAGIDFAHFSDELMVLVDAE